MADVIALTEPQLQNILSGIGASQQSWWPVASVFVSSFLGLLAGIALEQYKGYRTANVVVIDRQKNEISKINVAIVALGYNFENLCIIALQYIIPHYRQVHTLYEEIQKFQNDIEAMKKLAAVPFSSGHPSF